MHTFPTEHTSLIIIANNFVTIARKGDEEIRTFVYGK